jgi:hypothetical protein
MLRTGSLRLCDVILSVDDIYGVAVVAPLQHRGLPD